MNPVCCSGRHFAMCMPVVLLILAGQMSLSAQAGLGAAGGHTGDGEYTLNYSVGQVFNTVVEQSDMYISQGIQHPLPLVIDGNRTLELQGLDSIALFPNPVSEELFIYLMHPSPKDYQVELFNMKGELLIQKVFESNQLRLLLNDIAPGSYLLAIRSGAMAIRSFRIIKTH